MSDHVVPGEPRPELLRIYLNDHLAGSTGGLALARRLAGNHKGTPAGPELDAAQLDDLIENAERQSVFLEGLRVHAVAEARRG